MIYVTSLTKSQNLELVLDYSNSEDGIKYFFENFGRYLQIDT
jgi:hypothetical protein